MNEHEAYASLADKDSVEREFPFGSVKIVSDAISALQGALGQQDGEIRTSHLD